MADKNKDIIVSKIAEGIGKNKDGYLVTMELRQDGQFGEKSSLSNPNLINYDYNGKTRHTVAISKSQYDAIKAAAGDNVVEDGKATRMAVSGRLMDCKSEQRGDMGSMLNTKTVQAPTVPFDKEALENHRANVRANKNSEEIKDYQADNTDKKAKGHQDDNIDKDAKGHQDDSGRKRVNFMGMLTSGRLSDHLKELEDGDSRLSSFVDMSQESKTEVLSKATAEFNDDVNNDMKNPKSAVALNLMNSLRGVDRDDRSKLENCAHVDIKLTNVKVATHGLQQVTGTVYAFSAEVDKNGVIDLNTIDKSSLYPDSLPKDCARRQMTLQTIVAEDNKVSELKGEMNKDAIHQRQRLSNMISEFDSEFPTNPYEKYEKKNEQEASKQQAQERKAKLTGMSQAVSIDTASVQNNGRAYEA